MWSVAYNGAKLSENYKENEKEKWRGQNNIMEKSLIQGFDKLKDVNKIWGYRKLSGLCDLRSVWITWMREVI